MVTNFIIAIKVADKNHQISNLYFNLDANKILLKSKKSHLHFFHFLFSHLNENKLQLKCIISRSSKTINFFLV